MKSFKLKWILRIWVFILDLLFYTTSIFAFA